MRGMYPKSPAERRWGTHRANILPPRGAFAVRSPQIMHGAQILPSSDGLGPCAGAPARATASRDRLSTARPLCRDGLPYGPWFADPSQRLGPCSGVPTPTPRQYPPPANARHLPIPAARCTHCSQGQAADGLRRRSSGARPAVRPSPEGPPTTSSRRAGRQRNAAQNWAWIPEP